MVSLSLPNQLPPAVAESITMVLFDLDGVITSDLRYFDVARVTVREMFESEAYLGLSGYFEIIYPDMPDGGRPGGGIIADTFVSMVKNRAINSNWDLTYLAASLHLGAILTTVYQSTGQDWSSVFNPQNPMQSLHNVSQIISDSIWTEQMGNDYSNIFFASAADRNGSDLLSYLEMFLQEQTGLTNPFFRPGGAFWQFLYRIFQEWYADTRQSPYALEQRIQLSPEHLIVNADDLAAMLARLTHGNRFVLGIATGRPRAEALSPLRAHAIDTFFDSQRFITYDDVRAAEAALSEAGQPTSLAKPHPFSLLKAITPQASPLTLCAQSGRVTHPEVVYLGDSASDIVAAQQAGCIAIGVISSVLHDDKARQARQQRFVELGCAALLNTVLDLPQALGWH
ncbi:MAG: HAD family hydrolase [Chloroflexaceae bacterium]|nr:HAD family hydrolase [Chloroflexaceae bacterium]